MKQYVGGKYDKRERREQSGPTINVLATMEDAMCKLQL